MFKRSKDRAIDWFYTETDGVRESAEGTWEFVKGIPAGIVEFLAFVLTEPYQAFVMVLYLFSCGLLFAFLYYLGHLLNGPTHYSDFWFFLTAYFALLTLWSVAPYTVYGRFTFAPRFLPLVSTVIAEAVLYASGHHYAFWRMSALFLGGMLALTIADLMLWRDGIGNWKRLRAWGAMAAKRAAQTGAQQIYNELLQGIGQVGDIYASGRKFTASRLDANNLQISVAGRQENEASLRLALQPEHPRVLALIGEQKLTFEIGANENGEICFFRNHAEMRPCEAASEIVQLFLVGSSGRPQAVLWKY